MEELSIESMMYQRGITNMRKKFTLKKTKKQMSKAKTSIVPIENVNHSELLCNIMQSLKIEDNVLKTLVYLYLDKEYQITDKQRAVRTYIKFIKLNKYDDIDHNDKTNIPVKFINVYKRLKKMNLMSIEKSPVACWHYINEDSKKLWNSITYSTEQLLIMLSHPNNTLLWAALYNF
jgi:hypothetical protein|uniref:Uncharacterized protein n=1 Tax=viral metagenome TaxID=1070528 RepID=A0A6C0J4B5_9ZZZZ